MHLDATFQQVLLQWINQYGSVALLILLMFGIFALPIPDETLLILSGALIADGKLALIPTGIAAFVGSCCGISISYLLGRTAATYIIRKYSHWLRITDEKMDLVRYWFDRAGSWVLFFGYFLPGVRHITGYAAGVSELSYSKFALFSYSGALFWGITFLSLGYFLGQQWVKVAEQISADEFVGIFVFLGVLLVLIGVGGILRYYLKRKRQNSNKNI